MNRLRKLLLLLVALACLAGSVAMQRRLNGERARLGLTRVAPLENAPPVLAFTTVALGGFRGLIANALWIRANDLQQEDKFFEQVQLASWITKLEPHFTQVWLVQAWNMAYNISVKFRDPYDRWRWVRRGIELLRDEGIRYNPREALLYRELAWFFQHKMGQNLDDAHLVYKYEWAHEMQNVFGGPRPDFAALRAPRTDEERRRATALREVYRMDPARMEEMERIYGPLEWRLPEASAMYWAFVGLAESTAKDQTTLRRVIYQCLHMTVLRGRIILEREDGSYAFAPDLAKVEAAHAGYRQMLAEESDKPEVIQRAHRNFLREAVYLLYTHNRVAESARWMTILKQAYPGAVPPDETVDQYALKRMTQTISDLDHNRTRSLILGLLRQHFDNLVLDEDDRAAGFLSMARRIWQYYDSGIQARKGALSLPPLDEMRGVILNELLDPRTGMAPVYNARLRTKLGLPAATNAPAAPPAPRPGPAPAPRAP
ncbi:MAG: hypothetical protein RJA22_3237 [Verrucomicrobiota bacterium]|jgi:hypothetical protein